jgi:hypothetical protein
MRVRFHRATLQRFVICIQLKQSCGVQLISLEH